MTTGVAPARRGQKRKGSLLREMWKYRWIYLMLLPALVFFFVFKYMPLYGIQLAFKDYVLKGISASPWNDFAHFKYMTSEPGFLPAFRNTLIISFMRILIGFPFPVILALLINEMYFPRYRRLLQTIYTFPHFLSWVLLAGILLNLFGVNGMMRSIVSIFDPEYAENWNFLYDNGVFRWLLVFTDMWKEAGWGTIIYLAAITGIDASLYEASVIDGCGRWKKILYITLPGIMNMIAIQFVLRVGSIMEGGFDQVFNMYSPPVIESGDIIDTYIYRITFVRNAGLNMGFPTAVGLFKNVINFALLLLANTVTKALGQETIL